MRFTSQNLGAGKVKRIKKILATCQLCVIVTGLFAGLGAYAAGDFLLGLYSDDPAVIAAGFDRMYYVGRIYFICGIMDVFVGALRGMGASVGPMIVALLGACAFRLVWIATYFQAHHTINNLYISYPLSWALTGFVHFLTFLFVYRRACNRIKEN